jgi:hypothetical protein
VVKREKNAKKRFLSRKGVFFKILVLYRVKVLML